MTNVTRILSAIEQGDSQATDQLLVVVYKELRKLAAHLLSNERPGQTLQATALVHEAYLRLVGPGNESWENRRHFFGAAAEAMRRILVDAARRKKRIRHGGGRHREDLDESCLAIMPPSDDLLALDDALQRFSEVDPAKTEIVRLHYFGLFFTLADEIFLKRWLNFRFFNGLPQLLKEREVEPCMCTEFGSCFASLGMSSPRSA